MIDTRFGCFKLLILDCDGVLVNSEPIVCRTYWQILCAHGYRGSRETFQQRFSGVIEEEILAASGAGEQGLTACDLRAASQAALERELPKTSAFAPLIQDLKGRVCVASNSTPERLAFCAGRIGLGPELEGSLYSAPAIGAPKPLPHVHRLIASERGVTPEDCIIIEDSINGIAAARAFGGHAVGFTYDDLEESPLKTISDLPLIRKPDDLFAGNRV